MKILWNYLRPHRNIVILSLSLAAVSQVLTMVDPLIFGKIIDEYATNPNNLSQDELLKGVSFWLAIAVTVALLARASKAFQEYVTRMVVQKFGMQVFNDGL